MNYDLKAASILLMLCILMLCHMGFYPSSFAIITIPEIFLTVACLFWSVTLVVKAFLEKLGRRPLSKKMNEWATRPRNLNK
jgi:hypothetical protein